MPKQKTSSQAKKRFKVTATGAFRRRKAGQSHNFEHKPPKKKRGFDKEVPVAAANRRTVAKMLGRGGRG
jgi:large subunit ribosomal protein L35